MASLKTTLCAFTTLIMFIHLVLAAPLRWKTYPTTMVTGGYPVGDVLLCTQTADSVVIVTGPNNQRGFKYSLTKNSAEFAPQPVSNVDYLFDSAGSLASRGDKHFWLFGSLDNTYYTTAQAGSIWTPGVFPPFNLTNAAFIYNPSNNTYHVMGGLDRDTRQPNEIHWTQISTTVLNPWNTWPAPLSTLGADAQAYYEPIDQRIYTIDGNGRLQVLHLSNNSWTSSDLLYPVTKAGLVRVENELLIVGGETVPSTNGTMVQRMDLNTWQWREYPDELPVPYISRNNVMLAGEHVFGLTHEFMLVAFCANLSLCGTPDPGQCAYFCYNGTCDDPMAGCEDGNPCTTNDQCRAGRCVSGGKVADDTECDDGESCLLGDKCLDGQCRTGLIWNPDCTTPSTSPAISQGPSSSTPNRPNTPNNSNAPANGGSQVSAGPCIAVDFNLLSLLIALFVHVY